MHQPGNNERHPDAEFEAFRQERVKRRQQADPLRGLGREAEVLREIEAAEMEEAHDRQLSSDMQEFFSDAKRKAAGIVRNVTEAAEAETSERLRTEVEDFLTNLLERAHAFMRTAAARPPGGRVAQRTVEPQMHNLVGRPLDEFRHEGTAQLQDKHIGQNPFETRVDAVAQELRDTEARRQESGVLAAAPVLDPLAAPRAGGAPAQSIDEHLVAEVHGGGALHEPHPLIAWLGQDVDKVGAVLRVLVQHALISREEARSVYQALLEHP
jgi:hypothetical protein